MPALDEIVGSFLLTGASIIVIGLTVLLIGYKMIDGEFTLIPGIVALTACFVIMALVIKPPHPAIPAIGLVVVMTLVIFFPYALTMLEKADMQAIDTYQLERAYSALAAKPDNVSAKLEIAKMLYAHDMKEHAVAVAATALGGLSDEIDPLRNRSMRDLFVNEASLLRRWQHEAAGSQSKLPEVLKCPACARENKIGDILCAGCGRPYLLDTAKFSNIRERMIGRLVTAWAAVAALFVGGVAVALNFEGPVRIVLFLSAMAGTGAFLAWLFRPARAR